MNGIDPSRYPQQQSHYHQQQQDLALGGDATSAVFVSNLQWWTTDAELESLCSEFGTVTGIKFIEDRSCGKSRGMAVVEFTSPESVPACIEGLNGRDINGRPCKVAKQVQQQQRPMGGPGRGMMGRGGGMMGRGGRGMGSQDAAMMMGGPGGMPMDPSMMAAAGWGMPPPMMGGGPSGMPPPTSQQMGGGPPGFKPPPPPQQ